MSIDGRGVLYSGYYYSVQVSKDRGDSWESYYEGLKGQINFGCLAVNEKENVLYVGTTDEGMFSLNLNVPTNFKYNSEKSIEIFKLFPNYPNPFNQQTAISYILSTPCAVKLEIYNTLGQLVKTIIHENKQPGEYKVFWNGKDSGGKDVPSGVYFYRLEAGDFTEVKKMILVK